VAPAALKKVVVKVIPGELGKMLMATRQEATLEADVRFSRRSSLSLVVHC
jgi:hypothetical protein